MARSDVPSYFMDRLHGLVARASRPDLAVRLILAAARDIFPRTRVDVLIREPKRRWLTRAHRPAGAPLALSGASARGARRPSPQPPVVAVARDLRRDPPENAGDEALLQQGLRHRLIAPIRRPEIRGVLSLARPSSPFSEGDVATAVELAALLAPALAEEARLARALRAVERARFVQHLTAHVNRSLDVEDVMRAVARHLARRIGLDRAELVLVSSDGRPGASHALDAGTAFRDAVVTASDGDEAVLKAIRMREPTLQEDLLEVATPTEAERVLIAEGFRARALVPLVARRRLVGVVGLLSRQPRGVSGDALSLLRHVARPLAVALDNARLFHEAGQRMRQMTALYDVGQALNSAADVGDVIERVLWILHDTFAFQHSAVLTLERDEEGEWLVLQASRGYSLREGSSFSMRVGERGITSRAVRTGQLVYVPDVRRDPDYVLGVEQGRSEIAIPLVVGGAVIGVLDIESTKVDAFGEDDLDTVRLFSTQVAMALDRARAFEEIRRQAMTDGLTGLLNQRYFQEKVARELSRSQRTGRPFVLCLMDIDDFKLINDRHGHVRGNQAIARLGDVLKERIRSIDAAARFGGDEFAMILSETNAVSALTTVHDVQAALRSAGPGVDPIRVSVGIAEWHAAHASVRDIVAAADAALYKAKREGKDRASIAAAPDPSAGAPEEAFSS